MKEFRPLNQNVLLEVFELTGKRSLVIVPDSIKNKQQIAKVIAIGNIDFCELSIGDIVFHEQVNNKIDFDGKEYIIIPYSKILGKIVEQEK
jgi:chaperonin GroES